MAIFELTRLSRSMLVLLAAVLWLWRPLPASAETPIHFALDRKIDGPAAPFFVAIDKGYFQAEGLDVTIEPANGPLDPINRLAAGNYEMGVADINLLIKFRDANPGTAIKALFIVFDKPPYAVIARKSRGVEEPKDLEGKKLGAPSTEGTFAQWPIFARVNGIATAKVTIENVGLPVREPMLAAGEVDAITAYSFTSYIDLKAMGVPPDDLIVLLMADYGVKLYGNAIMATPKFAADKPEAARGFLRAYLKALKDTVRDPAGAIGAVLRRNGALTKDVELARLRMAIRDNIDTPAVRVSGYGGIDPARFAAAIDQLALVYSFKAKDKAADVFDSVVPAGGGRTIDFFPPRDDGSRATRHKRLQAIDGLGPAHFHALQIGDSELDHRDGAGVHRQLRLAELLGNGHCREAFEQMIACRIQRDVGEHEPLRRDDLADNALHRINGPVGAAHMDAQRTARPRLDFADRIGEAGGAPPLRQLLGIGPGLEHERARRIEDARDRHFSFGERRLLSCNSHDALLLRFFILSPTRRRMARS